MSLHYMIQGKIIKGFLVDNGTHMRNLVIGDMKEHDGEFTICSHLYEDATKKGIYIYMWRWATQEEIARFKATALIEGIDL